MAGKEILPVSADNKTGLIDAALHFMTRPWFVSAIEPPLDRKMSIFLMHIYANSEAGHPLHKKEAWKAVGIEEVKTGRKYIARAEELGLIETARSSEDKRKELLYPTARLADAVEKELLQLSLVISSLANTLFKRNRGKDAHGRRIPMPVRSAKKMIPFIQLVQKRDGSLTTIVRSAPKPSTGSKRRDKIITD